VPRTLVLFGALATGLIALWLVYVVAVVLPGHDPQRAGPWLAVAASFAIYAGVTVWSVLRAGRPMWLRWAVAALSLGAIAFGGYELESMRVATDGHFEGYLLVMGLVLGAQGVCALAYTTLAARLARRVRSAKA